MLTSVARSDACRNASTLLVGFLIYLFCTPQLLFCQGAAAAPRARSRYWEGPPSDALLRSLYKQGIDTLKAQDYQASEKVWKAGLIRARLVRDEVSLQVFLTNLGNVYAALGQNPLARSYYIRALRITKAS